MPFVLDDDDSKVHSNRSVQDDAAMPIAVIGIGGRFPGDASNPEKLWDLMANGQSALSEIPKDRFNIDAFYHPDAERRGSMNLRKAHFLTQDPAVFDAPFFSIAPNEAKSMDPQQRLALEVAYEALENAGIRMEDVVGSNTSCYVGCFTHDYNDMAFHDAENAHMYQATGTGSAILSNRISWFYDLKGTSITLDTACSSSLVALHLACQSLRTRESEQAIVGGTNFILMPDIMNSMTQLHFLSPDGKSKSFDEKGNGYGRGEGASFIIIKPLDAALRDNDVIRAVIRNTGSNQDGNTPGITLPSTTAQEALIRQTYAGAGLPLNETSFFEAHGTGTPAGDPLEARALGATFGKVRPPGDPLLVGSIKTNIGHLEGASGLAAVIKTILALEKGIIPPNLWFEKANPRIPMDELNIRVPTEATEWPNGLRRASVNSFGYGGTNAHAIIDDAYHYLKSHDLKGHHVTKYDTSPGSTPDSANSLGSPESSVASRFEKLGIVPTNWGSVSSQSYKSLELPISSPRLFVWSAHEQAGIDRASSVYTNYMHVKVTDSSDFDENLLLRRLAYTLSTRRSILPWKTFVVASSAKDLGHQVESPWRPIRSSAIPRIGFVFTGQGAQWMGMGRELCAHQVFLESLEAASSHLVALGCTWSLLAESLRPDEASRLNEAAFSQPMCTAVQIALVELLQHWNVTPNAVIGHSSGEIAAAFAKGSITREMAWTIAYHRGRLSQAIRGLAPGLSGAMLACGLGEADVQPYLNGCTNGDVVVACINSPTSVTLSGDLQAITQIEAMLKADGFFARRLKVDTAYHSPHMQVIAEKYFASLSNVHASGGNDAIKMFSSVTGNVVESTALSASYWVSNMLQPVKFSQALSNMCNHTNSNKGGRKKRNRKPYIDALIEIGPHSALQGPINQILDQEDRRANVTYASCLVRGQDACVTALEVVGKLFQQGLPVNVAKVNEVQRNCPEPAFLVDMPPFPWNRSHKFWFETANMKDYRLRTHPRKDLIGARTVDENPMDARWRQYLRVSENPWIEDHRAQNSILYPAAGMMVMAIEAAAQTADPHKPVAGYELRDISIRNAIVVPEEDGIETMLHMRPWRMGSRASTSAWNEFSIFSRANQEWVLNCSGLLQVHYRSENDPLFTDEEAAQNTKHRRTYQDMVESCSKPTPARHFYEQMTNIGLRYGPSFMKLAEIHKGNYKGQCTMTIHDTKSIMPHAYEYDHLIHPSTLDNILQMLFPAMTSLNEELTVAKVPTSIGRLFVSSSVPRTPGTCLQGYSKADTIGFRDVEASVVVSESSWVKPLVIAENVRCTALSTSNEGNAVGDVPGRNLAASMVWMEDVEKLDPKDMLAILSERLEGFDQVSPKIVEELEIGAWLYMKRALNTCSEKEAEGFEWHLKAYWDYMQHVRKRVLAGEIDHQSNHFDWLTSSDESEENLLARVEKSSADGAAMCRHGRHVVEILRRQLDPLQVLMEDNLLYKFYSDGIGQRRLYAKVAAYTRFFAHKTPSMDILEIGAGTGGTTLPVLQAIGGPEGSAPRFSSYTFTDITSGFFEAAREKTKPWASVMKFRKLNIEEEPADQGMEHEGYDVVIASLVLHATHSMDATVANVRKLVKPGGKLIFVEITHDLLRVPMVVGALSGWWMGQADGRQWSPNMSQERWHDTLVRQGFSGVDTAIHDFEDARDRCITMMISTATPIATKNIPDQVLIVEPDHPVTEIQSLSHTVIECLRDMGSSASITTLEQTLKWDLSNTACIIMIEAMQPLLMDIDAASFDAAKHVILDSAGCTWLTRGAVIDSEVPASNLMTGLARTIRAENFGLALSTLDLDPSTDLSSRSLAESIAKICVAGHNDKNLDRPDWEYAIRNGRLLVPRLVLEPGTNQVIASQNSRPVPEMVPFKQEGRALTLQVGVPGMLDTLQFVDDESHSKPLTANEVEVEIKASGLNFVDLMVSMGQITEPALGAECSGVVSRVGPEVTQFKPGDRVMTWLLGTFSSFIRTPEPMIQPIPEGMSFEVAASIPAVYVTAYHALVDAARLAKGETILIHSAAGGVGQAAIMLAQHLEAEIFVTVSSQVKKDLVMKKYGIAADHIFNSRSLTFVDGIMRMTGGKGIDVVLNSLAGEALRQSWLCLAWFGRFIEMGKRDIVGNTGLDMSPFIKNVSFCSVNILGILRNSVPIAARIFREAMGLLRSGAVKPVDPISVMPIGRIEEAFRLMQSGKHMGKIVLTTHDDDIVPVISRGLKSIEFDPSCTYLLSGGLGGLGRSISEWMLEHGARHLVFLSRSGSAKPEAQKTLAKLSKAGAHAAAYSCDITDATQVKAALAKAREHFPPIRGAIQGAMALHDATFQNMTHTQWENCLKPKAHGSWNLHEQLPRDMDFFLCLSSAGGVGGSIGQGNYSAGNTYQDALAAYRRSQGLAAITMDVGLILGIGFVAENVEVLDNMTSYGFIGVREQEFLAMLQCCIKGTSMNDKPVPAQLITGLGTGGMVQYSGVETPFWFRDAKFSHVRTIDTQRSVADTFGGEEGSQLHVQLAQVENVGTAVDLVTQALKKKLAKAMMMAVEDIDGEHPVSSYGVDSLVAVEVRTWLFKEIKADISVFDILSNVPLATLARTIVGRSKYVSEAVLEGES
ncbi:MAG: hypothetical protein L6R37_004889 [Teloschistes peruensis]|nr:MAG: hypothetical protein L6R37_004889 [Teloschistes peruensis]